MPALVIDAVVVEAKVGALPLLDDKGKPIFDVAVIDKAYTARRQAFARKVGVGVPVTIRIEPADEAATHGDHKHLHGHLLTPTSEWTGYTVTELKADMKARFLPDGMTSTTEMNHEQFVEFNRSVEQCIREEYPSECWDACAAAMALSDYRAG
jgi:hypothetical protein